MCPPLFRHYDITLSKLRRGQLASCCDRVAKARKVLFGADVLADQSHRTIGQKDVRTTGMERVKT